MKKLFISLVVISLYSCNSNKAITDIVFADSILTNYSSPSAIKNNAADLQFWQSRITSNPGIVNELKYAAALMGRFHLLGNIKDVKTADQILIKIDSTFNHKEAAPILALISHSILQHQFKQAENYLQKATSIGLKKYDEHAIAFDVYFETGEYNRAYQHLLAIKNNNDYGYQFRLSKWEHYKSNLEGSIAAMHKAIVLSGSDTSLLQAAISNTADLYLHNNNLEKAQELYKKSLQLSVADLHSLLGIGWIALAQDKNYEVADKIFKFVATKNASPDPIFKLIQMAEAKGDKKMAVQWANKFVTMAGHKNYGNMYNKYLIEIYNDILNEPAKAVSIATSELENRATPQTYAWYAYSLFKNGQLPEALAIFKEQVSGKPLEGLELFWVGKMMMGNNKGFNAKAFFKEAYKNRFDIMPAKKTELESISGIK